VGSQLLTPTLEGSTCDRIFDPLVFTCRQTGPIWYWAVGFVGLEQLCSEQTGAVSSASSQQTFQLDSLQLDLSLERRAELMAYINKGNIGVPSAACVMLI
jgi:hypothetical protein